MNIDDVYSSKNYYSSIKRNLKESYQIDMNYFESFHISKLKLLKEAAKRVIDQTNHVLFENNKIQSPLVPLNEALRVYLKEIYPQKRVKFKEHVNHDQQTINKSPQYILESILVKRLMDENTI